MGSRGPIPTDDPSKLKGHRTVVGVSLEQPAPDARQRRLPHAASDSRETRRWWRTWATSPQAGQFLDLDWLGLERLAPFVDAFFALDDPLECVHLLRVIRKVESAYGATVADRVRLRWRLAAHERTC